MPPGETASYGSAMGRGPRGSIAACAIVALLATACASDDEAPTVFEELDLDGSDGDAEGTDPGEDPDLGETDGAADAGPDAEPDADADPDPDADAGPDVEPGSDGDDASTDPADQDPRAGGAASADVEAWDDYLDTALPRSGSPEADVVTDYRSAWALVAEAHSSASLAADTDLSVLLTGEVLAEQLDFLRAAAGRGEATRGQVRLRPVVTDLEGDRAEVLDCYRSEGEVFDAAETVLRDFRTAVRYRVEMVREDGTWKQARLERLEGACG